MEVKENKQSHSKEQLITIANRESISISGTNKVLTIKSDLIQLCTTFGGLIIQGENLELVTLNNTSTCAEIKGSINALKFIEDRQKESFLRKIFK